MPERLKDLGLLGLMLFFALLLLPVSALSFFITVQLTFTVLFLAVFGVLLLYVLLLPTAVLASLTGNTENQRFLVVGVALTVALTVGGLGYLNVKGEERRAAFRAELQADIEAGERMRCAHPELDGTGEGTQIFATDMLYSAVQLNGWTCYTAGRVHAPSAGAWNVQAISP